MHEMLVNALLICNAASAPSTATNLCNFTAVAVLLLPAPAITCIRSDLAVSTAVATTCSCSCALNVGDSPVVPQGTIPATAPSACARICRLKHSTSTRVASLVNGVTMAVQQPDNASGLFELTCDPPTLRL